jgi:hypothetical protein
MERQRETQARVAETSDTEDSIQDTESPNRAPLHPVLQLQQSIGNRALQRLVGSRSVALQPKLTVGAADDPYEREADRVAEKVVSMPASAPTVTGQSFVQLHAPERGEVSQAGSFEPGADFETWLSNCAGGSPLPAATREFMEPRFGADFSGVRLHTGTEAAQLTGAVSAKAFTHGPHIYLADGKEHLESGAAKQLLAHELTHTIQQSAVPTHDAPAIDCQELANAGEEIRSGPVGFVQRFESEEHQHLGDVATGSAAYDLGGKNDRFELTHGDILALSGDVFMPDELFRLAAIPGNRGQSVGTRDEVLWALQDPRIWEMRAAKSGPYAGKADPRFVADGPYANYTYSPAVKDAVFDRYRKLGAANAGHFVAPQGRDATGAPIPASESAGSNYTTLHEVAMREADKAGRAGVDIGMALAREAAAQHFLTDAFSAGHLRTPAAAIRDYWGGKYPLFWYNLRHKIALDTAIEMTSGTPITNYKGYTEILASVEAMAPSLPAVTLGDLLASVFHDVDNEQGLSIEGGGKVMGDSHLDAGTEKLAVGAIRAGNRDITKAYEIGKAMSTPVPDADLFAQVRFTNGGSGSKYAAELQMPEPAKTEPPQNWKASDINALWDQPLLGTAGETVGQVISKRVKGGSIAIQLRSLAENFPEKATLGLHPRASYLKGFVERLQANPKAGVLDIINWAPHDMSTGDAALESGADLERKGAAGDKKENLASMTLEQRTRYVALLIQSGRSDDQEMIIKIFANATVPDRPEIYKGIEGHAWTGDFNHSLGSRDKLYKVMDAKRVDTLKNSINGL